MKTKFKTCPKCGLNTCYSVVQVETEDETAYLFDNCLCGYNKSIYNQDNEIENKDFYKDSPEGLEAKKYLNKLKQNRDSVKKFREKNERKRISIDYIPDDFETNLKAICEIMRTSQAKALNQLMIEFLKNY